MSSITRGTIEMSFAMSLLGTIGWVVVQSGQPVVDLVFWRCVFGAATLLVVCAALGLFRGTLTPRVIAFAALGGATLVANWLLIFAAFPRASIAIATAVYSTQPFMLLGFGVLFFGERLTLAKLAWLGLTFAGLLMIVQAKPGAAYVGTDYAAGIAMAFGAGLLYALTAILTKKLDGTPPHLITLIQVCVGIVLLAPFANLAHLPSDAGSWAALVALGVVYTGLLFTLQYAGIQKLPTHLTGSLYFLYPVVAIMVDVLAFGHGLQVMQVLGAAAILFAATAMNLGWSPWRAKAAANASRG